MNKWVATLVIVLSFSGKCAASEKLKSYSISKAPRQLMTGVVKVVSSLLENRVVRVLSIPVIAVAIGYGLKEKEVPYDSDPFNMRNETRPSRH